MPSPVALMNPDVFSKHVRELCQQHGGSITSWGRTLDHDHAVQVQAHEPVIIVGGPHTWWNGADVVWDHRPALDLLTADAARRGLHVIRSSTHDHFQPIAWVNAPHEGAPA